MKRKPVNAKQFNLKIKLKIFNLYPLKVGIGMKFATFSVVSLRDIFAILNITKETQMNRTTRNSVAFALTAFSLGMSHVAQAQTAYLLGNQGSSLYSFDLATPGTVNLIGVLSGATTSLNDIDFRVSNGLLYGYNQTTNQIVTINTATGATTFVSSPVISSGNISTGIDFNPVADRLRVVNYSDQNLRINVDTGATTVDGTLAYAAGDVNAGANPNILDVAYTNNDNNPATGTTLYYLESNSNTLVTTSNPNGGTLNTVGALGFALSGNFGFDIFTSSSGVNSAYAFGSNGLYNINLATGAGTFVSGFSNVGGVFGLAITPATASVPEPGNVALLAGILVTGAGFLTRRFRRSSSSRLSGK